jgi:ribulose-5-phosphate 4-epimerase/fuculose-1-phosphate aldolase
LLHQKKNACIASSDWQQHFGYFLALDLTKVWQDISPLAIQNTLIASGLTLLECSLIRVSDLILVNQQGEVIEGDRPINQAAFAIHSQVHTARPDVVAAAHAHSLYGKSWSSLGRLLDPLTQDACSFYEDHSLFDDYTGVVLQPEEGKRIAKTLGDNKAIILKNHGLLTVGHSVDEAAWWFITMERSCQAQLLAEAAGKPVPIQHEYAHLAHSQVGSHFMGWFSFQPLYEMIVRQEPDLLE